MGVNVLHRERVVLPLPPRTASPTWDILRRPMRVPRPFTGAALGVLIACGSSSPKKGPEPSEVLVSAAASLHDMMEEAGATFHRVNPNVTVTFNFGASGQLLKQIELGAPTDLFISASRKEIDQLLNSNLAAQDRVWTLAGNELVIVTDPSTETAVRPEDLSDPRFDRIAVGNPKTVPAGRYAEESLRALGLWETVQPRLVFGEDVRQVVEYVARGDAPAGIVYATDARQFEGRVRTAAVFPPASHSPIFYLGVIPSAATHRKAPAMFMEFLSTAEGKSPFASFGFAPPASDANSGAERRAAGPSATPAAPQPDAAARPQGDAASGSAPSGTDSPAAPR